MRTTADIRAMLMAAMEDVEAGKMDVDKARTIVKLAAQINESLYAEVKAIRTLMEIGKSVDIANIGALQLGSGEVVPE